MLDSLTLLPLPTLHGQRVILRGPRDSDVDDRLRYPIDPEEEDCYGSSWRREWDGRRYHTREYLTATKSPPDPPRCARPDQRCARARRRCRGRIGVKWVSTAVRDRHGGRLPSQRAWQDSNPRPAA